MNVTIIGAGLMGSSLGMALRATQSSSVLMVDRDRGAAEAAVDRGAADVASVDIREACASADVIFAATPVSSISSVIISAAKVAKSGAVLSDLGSTKSQVVIEIENELPPHVSFIGGHPIAGSEETGGAAARSDMFAGAHWILTPTGHSSSSAYGILHGLLSGLGAKIVALDPATHDDLVAVVSHVPQLLASTLMRVAEERTRERPGSVGLAGRGFRDMTRIAASHPGIWLDICEQNAEAIQQELGVLIGHLEEVRSAVTTRDRGGLERMLFDAHKARRAMRDKPGGGPLFEIIIPIPDRPGLLSLVTSSIGARGINIEDLRITHGADGSRGLLSVIVAGEDKAISALEALSSQGLSGEVISL